MKKLLKRFNKLNILYRLSVYTLTISALLAFMAYLMTGKGYLLGLSCGMGSVLVGYYFYLYKKTKGFTKFASFNDERLLMLAGDAYKITLFIIGLVALFVAGIFSGQLMVAHKYGELVYNTEQIIQLTFIATIMGVYFLFQLIYIIVYFILKAKK